MVSEQHFPHHDRHEILLCGLDLQVRSAHISDVSPTGAQIAEAAGFPPTPDISVLQWLERGLEDVRPTETVDLRDGNNRFIVAETDGSWRMIIDGVRFDWPAREISVGVARILANVSTEKAFFQVDAEEGEILLNEHAVLDLALPGVEVFKTRVPSWKLNVQGVVLTIPSPKIVVRHALELAGVNADQGWHIFLIVRDQSKREVQLDDEIDLTAPGIEKLRLTPKDVNNGEGLAGVIRQFRLMPNDEHYLDATYPGWRSIVDNGRQWLMLPDYPLPQGYATGKADMAIEIPPTYPVAQLDMFFLYPATSLSSGVPIAATEHRESIQGAPYQRWSRHRNGSSIWRPNIDNVMSHLALVEAALLKEVQL
jgi:hypothetical protein